MEIPKELIEDLFEEAIRDLRNHQVNEEKIFQIIKKMFGIQYARRLLQ